MLATTHATPPSAYAALEALDAIDFAPYAAVSSTNN